MDALERSTRARRIVKLASESIKSSRAAKLALFADARGAYEKHAGGLLDIAYSAENDVKRAGMTEDKIDRVCASMLALDVLTVELGGR